MVVGELESFIEARLSSGWGRRHYNDKSGASSADGLELHRLIHAAAAEDRWPAQSQQWLAIEDRLRQHPSEALVLDSRGRTALMAVMDKAAHVPASTLRAILQETRFHMETARDKTGWTALYIALHVYAPISSLEVLLEKNGKGQILTANHQGDLPLHAVLVRRRRRTEDAIEEPRRRELVELLLERGEPRQLLYENNRGLTPLHVAMENRLAPELIEMLVQACPEALSRHACGYTPLILAIREEAPAIVLDFLIASDPSTTLIRDLEGKSPLRRALEARNYRPALIEGLATRPELIEEKDGFGRNCLVVLLEQWSSQPSTLYPTLAQILVSVAPAAAEDYVAENGKRRTSTSPCSICYTQYSDTEGQLRHARELGRATRVEQLAPIVEHWWQVLRVILPAAHAAPSSLLAALSTAAPPKVIRRLLDEDPSMASIADTAGVYPLHIASVMESRYKGEVFASILQCDPSRAGCPDSNGRYPLMLVAETAGLSAQTWKDLIHAYSEGVDKVDPATGLYPFLSVACSPAWMSDAERLDATFELFLAAAPNLMAQARICRR